MGGEKLKGNTSDPDYSWVGTVRPASEQTPEAPGEFYSQHVTENQHPAVRFCLVTLVIYNKHAVLNALHLVSVYCFYFLCKSTVFTADFTGSTDDSQLKPTTNFQIVHMGAEQQSLG